MAVFNRTVRQVVPELGNVKSLTNTKAKRLLGRHPRPKKETPLDTADSLLQLKLVKPAN